MGARDDGGAFPYSPVEEKDGFVRKILRIAKPQFLDGISVDENYNFDSYLFLNKSKL